MKLPNGYGSISKLPGNRRRPYMVRKIVGTDDDGRPIYKIIGYTATREEGLALLAKYNGNPWNIDAGDVKLSDLFAQWAQDNPHKLSDSNLRALKSAYKYLVPLQNMQYRTIRAYQMQQTIDRCNQGPSTQAKIKNLWRHLDRFALEMDVPIKGHAALLSAAPAESTTSRVPFTDDEINLIWDDVDAPWADTVLIMLYSGWRIGELLTLRKEDINMVDQTMKGGIKTTAGKNRFVPIHPRILPLIEKRMEEPGEYLIGINGGKCTQTPYRRRWAILMDRWGMQHTPHECRHTFRTRLDAVGANQRCCDLLMGHASKDVGNRVYNHKTLADLKNAISLLP